MNTITLTEAELQEKIDEAVSSATKELISRHNGEMANMRKENKALKEANLSKEELAQQQAEAQKEELENLRAFKKSAIISERLAKENLPSYLKNDSRLLNATDETFDKVLKQVKANYESSLPKGNSHSSVVQVASTVKETSSKETAYAKMGEALNSLLGK